jgi:hypothetical protein
LKKAGSVAKGFNVVADPAAPCWWTATPGQAIQASFYHASLNCNNYIVLEHAKKTIIPAFYRTMKAFRKQLQATILELGRCGNCATGHGFSSLGRSGWASLFINLSCRKSHLELTPIPAGVIISQTFP